MTVLTSHVTNASSTLRLTIHSFLVLVIISVYACRDHLLESLFVMNPRDSGSDNYIEAIVDLQRTGINDLEFISEEIIGIENEGKGNSNLQGNIKLSSCHEERLVSQLMAPRIEFAKSSLYSDSNRDALNSIYTGSGSNRVLNIQGGKGKFMHTNASLNVRKDDNRS